MFPQGYPRSQTNWDCKYAPIFTRIKIIDTTFGLFTHCWSIKKETDWLNWLFLRLQICIYIFISSMCLHFNHHTLITNTASLITGQGDLTLPHPDTTRNHRNTNVVSQAEYQKNYVMMPWKKRLDPLDSETSKATTRAKVRGGKQTQR